ncbi:MAG: uracil phosphoribosyltransferase [Bacteroidetes bacterium]|nr:MAG: uracil phosphoribosyltransferase [Bacteroidota bacterium]
MDSRITVVGNRHSYLSNVLLEMRSEELQQDRMRFRLNLERTGEILAYEISKELSYVPQTVRTPLGELEMHILENQPVVVSIMRAGLPFHQGFLRIFDKADSGFISAYRHHQRGSNEFEVRIEYMATPELGGRDLILVDPMIATGKSIVLAYREMLEKGEPERVFIAGVVGSDEGVEYIHRHIPKARFFLAGLDHELTARAYIVPGLGDAGDLAYGPK